MFIRRKLARPQLLLGFMTQWQYFLTQGERVIVASPDKLYLQGFKDALAGEGYKGLRIQETGQ